MFNFSDLSEKGKGNLESKIMNYTHIGLNPNNITSNSIIALNQNNM
jgi:hypothetical protein